MIRHIFNSFSGHQRARRGDYFRRMLRPAPGTTVLDLGGGSGGDLSAVLPWREDITLADHDPESLSKAGARGYRTVLLDATERLPFADGEFDIVFCNSVIEHVTGPKERVVAMTQGADFRRLARRSQARFAAEIARVGRSYFAQTPNRYFPIEPHSWLPAPLALTPRPLQVRILRMVARSRWPTSPQADRPLLTVRDMRRLFPDAQITIERVVGWPKSLIALRSC